MRSAFRAAGPARRRLCEAVLFRWHDEPISPNRRSHHGKTLHARRYHQGRAVAGYSVWVEEKPRQERLIRRFRVRRQGGWQVALYLANTFRDDLQYRVNYFSQAVPVGSSPETSQPLRHYGETFFSRAHAHARMVKKRGLCLLRMRPRNESRS